MNAIRQFLSRVCQTGVRRPGCVRTVAMGRERVFRAWDIGDDTFIFEKGISTHLGERPSVLVAEKRDLRHGKVGRVFTMTTGNHSVAAFPLLDGRFWKISRLPSSRRGDVLMHCILCANVVSETIEISQRDVPSPKLYAADGWLLGSLGFAMNDIVMGDRNETTLAHYRELGQEWRVKPLAWTEREMSVALRASRKRISTDLTYYHSSRGVHFLSYSDFHAFAELARADFPHFREQLRVLNMGLENRLGDNVDQFSGGQRQALTLLMAVMSKPSLLLLDEHTAALDPTNAEIVMNLTRRFAEDYKLTVMMVTHNMQHALDFGNRLLMMNKGEIISDIQGKEKENLTMDSIVELFKKIKVNNDNVLLS